MQAFKIQYVLALHMLTKCLMSLSLAWKLNPALDYKTVGLYFFMRFLVVSSCIWLFKFVSDYFW